MTEQSERGKLFVIDSRVWAEVTALGLNEAVAYLVLAQGTERGNRRTRWSTNAVMKYAGVGWIRAKTAIDRLLDSGFIVYGDDHTSPKPRYAVATASELAHLAGCESQDSSTWLPNSIVVGTSKGEQSPLRRLRSNGCAWTLRMFVDLYAAQNLRDDGGIDPRIVWGKYHRCKIGEQGAYVLWGFRPETRHLWPKKVPFAAHQIRPSVKGETSPEWESLQAIEREGLLSFVPHLFENSTASAEPIHPYGIGGIAESPVEKKIGDLANLAAKFMALESKLDEAYAGGFCYFCPVLKTFRDVQMMGVARLTYRPHTRRTSAWFAQLEADAGRWLEHYDALAAKGVESAQGRTLKRAMFA